MEKTKLNLEEKKQLERLALAKIQNAKAELSTKEVETQEELEKQLLKTPEAQAFMKLVKQQKELSRKVNGNTHFYSSYAKDIETKDSHPEIRKHERHFQTLQANLDTLKENIIVKIYSGDNSTMSDILDSLVKELSKIIK